MVTFAWSQSFVSPEVDWWTGGLSRGADSQTSEPSARVRPFASHTPAVRMGGWADSRNTERLHSDVLQNPENLDSGKSGVRCLVSGVRNFPVYGILSSSVTNPHSHCRHAPTTFPLRSSSTFASTPSSHWYVAHRLSASVSAFPSSLFHP